MNALRGARRGTAIRVRCNDHMSLVAALAAALLLATSCSSTALPGANPSSRTVTSTPCPVATTLKTEQFVQLFNARDVDRLAALFLPTASMTFTAVGASRSSGWEVDGDSQVLRRLLADRMSTGERLEVASGGTANVRGVLPDGRTRTFTTKFALDCTTGLFKSVLIAESP